MNIKLRKLSLVTLTVFLILGWTSIGLGQKMRGVAQTRGQSASAEDLLRLGDFYYNSNDTNDLADKYYRQAINRAPGTRTAGLAQFNRGNYWLRKFYIIKDQRNYQDQSALVEATGQYYDFIDKFASSTKSTDYVADAEYFLALTYLQQGKRDYAIGWLNQVISDSKMDQTVYIYKVVWSPVATDVIDKNFNAEEIAVQTRGLISKGLDFNSVVASIKRWSRGNNKAQAY